MCGLASLYNFSDSVFNNLEIFLLEESMGGEKDGFLGGNKGAGVVFRIEVVFFHMRSIGANIRVI